MPEQEQFEEPTIEPIFNGWAAYGPGWAVHSDTPEGALQKFQERKQYRDQLEALYRKDSELISGEESTNFVQE